MNFTEFIKIFVCCCIPKFKLYKWKKRYYQNVDNMDIKDEKLINCAVSSSHNSVLGQMQICTRASLYPIYKSLNYNFRMIELDVFYIDNEFKVAHGRDNSCIATNTISLESCFEAINACAWRDTNMPLFISLELHTNAIEQLTDLINEHFGNKLYQNKIKQLSECTISELKDKIIFLSGKNLPFEPKYRLTNISVNDPPNGHSNLLRIYPDNKVLSTNYDFYKFTPYGNFISINSCYKDKYYYQYIGYFNMGIVRKGGSFITQLSASL